MTHELVEMFLAAVIIVSIIYILKDQNRDG